MKATSSLFVLVLVCTTLGTSQTGYSEKGEVSVSFIGDTIIVWNKNIRENCCSRFQFSIVFLDSNIIVITETDTVGPVCSCDCPFDLSVKFTGLGGGHYTAEIFRQYLQQYYHSYQARDTTVFIGSVDFKIDSGGSTQYSGHTHQSVCLAGLSIEDEIKLPSGFELFANYPNPFNPTTEIRYQIAVAGHVTLKISDVLGRAVATLVDEVKQPGEYTVRWDASDRPSGVYFYRIIASTFTKAKKMILTK